MLRSRTNPSKFNSKQNHDSDGESGSDSESEHDHRPSNGRKQLERIDRIGNKIYFYHCVNSKNMLKLKKVYEECIRDIIPKSIDFDFDPVIELHIYSDGGDVFMGLDMYKFIVRMNKRVPTHTYVDGFLASSATFIYLAGVKRFISQYDHILMHQISIPLFYGKHEEMLDECENNESIMRCLHDLYTNTTTLSKSMLKKLLKNELYLNYSECIKYGISELIDCQGIKYISDCEDDECRIENCEDCENSDESSDDEEEEIKIKPKKNDPKNRKTKKKVEIDSSESESELEPKITLRQKKRLVKKSRKSSWY
jgi:ATP-dependent protease ClpP protease subunit